MKVYRTKLASVALLTGILSMISSVSIFGQNMFRKVNDFDGDGKADYAVTRNVNGSKYWYVWKSASGPNLFQWGTDTDLEAAGDYDGDGKTDLSIYRKVNGCVYNSCEYDFYSFWIRSTLNGSTYVRSFHDAAGSNVVPFQQNYNGSGYIDVALAFNRTPAEGLPFVRYYGTATNFINKTFNQGDTPLRLGDMTGDGKSDVVSVDANNVVTIRNSATDALQTIRFGAPGDEYVPADFDGDGKGDLAIFRQSNGAWWWIRSSDNSVQAAQFGLPGDKPVPADYDGDGKTDLAIWRPGETQSYYWVYGSSGNVWAIPFGIPTDTVIRY